MVLNEVLWRRRYVCGKVWGRIDMKFSSAILSVVPVVLAGLVALSLISPPGKVRVGLYISIGVLSFIFVWLRVVAKKVPVKEYEPWDI
ncbi:hypothetical protein [Paracidovorax avenae]|uniref:hypothetical protein n=1 Tax=Paracidovorax avenae TaxID=80867 RepID=UPI001AD83ACA|nr:hypothetical protein [Paracidovorax avenae]